MNRLTFHGFCFVHLGSHMPYTTCLTLHTIVFVGKLPHNIIRCKAYGIPNAQNKTCEIFLDQPDDDCQMSKYVALMLYFKC